MREIPTNWWKYTGLGKNYVGSRYIGSDQKKKTGRHKHKRGKMLRIMRKLVGTGSEYNRGKVIYIDFTYSDYTVVYVQYKTKTVAYHWQG